MGVSAAGTGLSCRSVPHRVLLGWLLVAWPASCMAVMVGWGSCVLQGRLIWPPDSCVTGGSAGITGPHMSALRSMEGEPGGSLGEQDGEQAG